VDPTVPVVESRRVVLRNREGAEPSHDRLPRRRRQDRRLADDGDVAGSRPHSNGRCNEYRWHPDQPPTHHTSHRQLLGNLGGRSPYLRTNISECERKFPALRGSIIAFVRVRHPLTKLLLIATFVCLTNDDRASAQAALRTHVVIVVDGLRPDDVTAPTMPRLTRLGQRGVIFNAHHSVFPTVTRVNSSSMVTGMYPEGHGLLGNTIYIASVNATRGLDTGVYTNLEAVARASGRLLTAPTLGEILQKAGKKLLTAGSGSSGALFLLDP